MADRSRATPYFLPAMIFIGWEEFEKTLSRKRLQIYESGGWMKIMAGKK